MGEQDWRQKNKQLGNWNNANMVVWMGWTGMERERMETISNRKAAKIEQTSPITFTQVIGEIFWK